MLNWLFSLFYPKTFGSKRSPEWPKLRAKHLLKEPCCQVCGTKKNLEVHHIKPVHLFPHLELSEYNLSTLCEPHHLLFGHLMNYKRYNTRFKKDVKEWRERINNGRL